MYLFDLPWIYIVQHVTLEKIERLAEALERPNAFKEIVEINSKRPLIYVCLLLLILILLLISISNFNQIV